MACSWPAWPRAIKKQMSATISKMTPPTIMIVPPSWRYHSVVGEFLGDGPACSPFLLLPATPAAPDPESDRRCTNQQDDTTDDHERSALCGDRDRIGRPCIGRCATRRNGRSGRRLGWRLLHGIVDFESM